MHAGFEVDIDDECNALPPVDGSLAARRREAQMFRLDEGRGAPGLSPNSRTRMSDAAYRSRKSASKYFDFTVPEGSRMKVPG
jgi:hypothetical protein